MATIRDNYALGIDVSKYQTKVDWPLVKQGGVSFAISRASCGTEKDPMFASHVQGAYDVDIPMLAYHAVDPGYYAYKLQSLDKLRDASKWLPPENDEQFQRLKAALKFKKIYGIAIDFEINKDWSGNVMTDVWLLEVAKYFCNVVAANYPQYPLIFYTGPWFIWNYCRLIEQTAALKDLTNLWVAYYPYSTGRVTLSSWSQIKANYPPNTMTVQFPGEPSPRQTQNPPYLGWDGWTFWQFSGDKFILPGIQGGNGPSAVDLNFYNGTKEKLYSWLKFTPRGTTPPPTDPGTPTPTDPGTPTPTTPGTTDVAAQLAAINTRLDALTEMNAKLDRILTWINNHP